MASPITSFLAARDAELQRRQGVADRLNRIRALREEQAREDEAREYGRNQYRYGKLMELAHDVPHRLLTSEEQETALLAEINRTGAVLQLPPQEALPDVVGDDMLSRLDKISDDARRLPEGMERERYAAALAANYAGFYPVAVQARYARKLQDKLSMMGVKTEAPTEAAPVETPPPATEPTPPPSGVRGGAPPVAQAEPGTPIYNTPKTLTQLAYDYLLGQVPNPESAQKREGRLFDQVRLYADLDAPSPWLLDNIVGEMVALGKVGRTPADVATAAYYQSLEAEKLTPAERTKMLQTWAQVSAERYGFTPEVLLSALATAEAEQPKAEYDADLARGVAQLGATLSNAVNRPLSPEAAQALLAPALRELGMDVPPDAEASLFGLPPSPEEKRRQEVQVEYDLFIESLGPAGLRPDGQPKTPADINDPGLRRIAGDIMAGKTFAQAADDLRADRALELSYQREARMEEGRGGGAAGGGAAGGGRALTATASGLHELRILWEEHGLDPSGMFKDAVRRLKPPSAAEIARAEQPFKDFQKQTAAAGSRKAKSPRAAGKGAQPYWHNRLKDAAKVFLRARRTPLFGVKATDKGPGGGRNWLQQARHELAAEIGPKAGAPKPKPKLLEALAEIRGE